MITGSLNTTVTFSTVVADHTPEMIAAALYLLESSRFDQTTGCWHWTKTLATGGYGQITTTAVFDLFRAKGAHRASKMLFDGWRPEDRHEHHRHRCGSRDCINPMHALTGSASDNWSDRAEYGSYGAKLTVSKVRDIKSRSGESSRLLAIEYGVHRSVIHRIRRGVLWKNVS
jgi:hypothetical protein